jgi:hypothetical protein
MTTAADVGAALRKDAKRNTGKEPSFRFFNGWKFGLSYGPTPMPGRDVVDRFKKSVAERLGAPKEIAEASYEKLAEMSQAVDAAHLLDHEWIFSASLHPRGRGSVEADWNLLGQMVAAVGAPIDSCKTPVETTHPNDVHYWIWIDAGETS